MMVASQVNFDEMDSQVKVLKKELDSCMKKVNKVMKHCEESRQQPFKDNMKTFEGQAVKNLTDIKHEIQLSKTRYSASSLFL